MTAGLPKLLRIVTAAGIAYSLFHIVFVAYWFLFLTLDPYSSWQMPEDTRFMIVGLTAATDLLRVFLLCSLRRAVRWAPAATYTYALLELCGLVWSVLVFGPAVVIAQSVLILVYLFVLTSLHDENVRTFFKSAQVTR